MKAKKKIIIHAAVKTHDNKIKSLCGSKTGLACLAFHSVNCKKCLNELKA